MMQVKPNSREFKDIREIFDDYKGFSTGKKWIRLYSVKPYESIDKRILLNDLKRNAAGLYNMNYETITEYLRDRSKKLFREDEETIYYFKSSQRSKWIEFPFELTGKLKKKVFPLKKVK